MSASTIVIYDSQEYEICANKKLSTPKTLPTLDILKLTVFLLEVIPGKTIPISDNFFLNNNNILAFKNKYYFNNKNKKTYIFYGFLSNVANPLTICYRKLKLFHPYNNFIDEHENIQDYPDLFSFSETVLVRTKKTIFEEIQYIIRRELEFCKLVVPTKLYSIVNCFSETYCKKCDNVILNGVCMFCNSINFMKSLTFEKKEPADLYKIIQPTIIERKPNNYICVKCLIKKNKTPSKKIKCTHIKTK